MTAQQGTPTFDSVSVSADPVSDLQAATKHYVDHTAPTSSISASGEMNVNAASLPKWRAAVARVRAGTGRGRLLMIGDSTTAGVGAGTGTGGQQNLIGAYAKTSTRALSALLAGYMPVSDKSFCGDQIVQGVAPVNYVQYDTRVTAGAGWFSSGSVAVIGGSAIRYLTGSASTLSFTPVGPVDHVKIWFIAQGGRGSFTTNIDGGASLGTTSTNNATVAMLSATFTFARGQHTINFVALNDFPMYFAAIEAWDSTTPAVDIFQAGYSGSVILGWVQGAAYNPPAFLPLFAPDLTIINLTINDSNGGTSLSSYTTNMQALITACQTTGDVVLMAGAPSNTTQATDGTLDGFIGVLQSLAISNGCALISLKKRWTSWAAANALMPYFDNYHPTAVGYQDAGASIVAAISQPIGGYAPAIPSSQNGSGYYAIYQGFPAAALTGLAATETNLAAVKIPAGTLGANGSIRVVVFYSCTNNANNKQITVRYNALSGVQASNALGITTVTTVANGQIMYIIHAAGVVNSQQTYVVQAGTAPFGSGAAAPAVFGLDTTVDTYVNINGTIANGADTLTLLSYTVEVLHP
jgi:lysophospholipase L1-like esterase